MEHRREDARHGEVPRGVWEAVSALDAVRLAAALAEPPPDQLERALHGRDQVGWTVSTAAFRA